MKFLGDCLANPDVLLLANHGDTVAFGNDMFKLEQIAGGVCFTSVDSKLDEFMNPRVDFSDSGFLTEEVDDSYSTCIRHVRIDGRALVSRREMIQAIHTNTFSIDKWSSTC